MSYLDLLFAAKTVYAATFSQPNAIPCPACQSDEAQEKLA